jgi:hypothetical protein
MVGPCLNTVARRVVLNPEASVLDLLREVQVDQTEIGKHEYISLTEIQAMGIPISTFFRSLLNFRNLPGDQDLVAEQNNPRPDNIMISRGGFDGYGVLPLR